MDVSDRIPSIPEWLVCRVRLEGLILEEKFPGAFRQKEFLQNRIGWTGEIAVEGNCFPLEIIYPPAYPAQPPELWSPFEVSPGCPHVLRRATGRFMPCWLNPHARSLGRVWRPGRHTAATAAFAAQRWFLAFLVWRVTGRWPVPDGLR